MNKKRASHTLTAPAEVIALGDNAFRFIISTAHKDRGKDIMVPEGCELKHYNNNPVVLFDHGLQLTTPIGSSRNPVTGEVDVKVIPGERIEATWYPNDLADSQIIRDMVRKGQLNCASIGWDEIESEELPDGSKRHKRWELVEWSVVPIPMNPHCGRIASFKPKTKAARIYTQVPIRRQDTNFSCGAACLWSVAGYYGTGPADEVAFMDLVKTDPAIGTEVNDLCNGAEKLGLTTRVQEGMTLEQVKRELLRNNCVIALIQAFGGGHYVCIVGFEGNDVWLQDPAVGYRSMSAEQFAKDWQHEDTRATGIVLSKGATGTSKGLDVVALRNKVMSEGMKLSEAEAQLSSLTSKAELLDAAKALGAVVSPSDSAATLKAAVVRRLRSAAEHYQQIRNSQFGRGVADLRAILAENERRLANAKTEVEKEDAKAFITYAKDQLRRYSNPGRNGMAKTMNHAEYQNKLKSKTDAELNYIISDASAAIKAMPDGENAGYYQDEIHYATAEKRRRQQGKGGSMDMPNGAKAIMDTLQGINSICMQIEDHVKTVEQPDVLDMIQTANTALKEMMADMTDAATKLYPDVSFDVGVPEEIASEAEEAEEDTEGTGKGNPGYIADLKRDLDKLKAELNNPSTSAQRKESLKRSIANGEEELKEAIEYKRYRPRRKSGIDPSMYEKLAQGYSLIGEVVAAMQSQDSAPDAQGVNVAGEGTGRGATAEQLRGYIKNSRMMLETGHLSEKDKENLRKVIAANEKELYDLLEKEGKGYDEAEQVKSLNRRVKEMEGQHETLTRSVTNLMGKLKNVLGQPA